MRRNQRICQGLKNFSCLINANVIRNSKNPRQNTINIAINNSNSLLKSKGSNGSSSVIPDTFELQQIFVIVRKFPFKPIYNIFGCKIHISGTGVIAQSLP